MGLQKSLSNINHQFVRDSMHLAREIYLDSESTECLVFEAQSTINKMLYNGELYSFVCTSGKILNFFDFIMSNLN